MLDILNLVRGAVSDKQVLPVLTHFHIYNGRVQGVNGRIAIDSVCAPLKGIEVTVPADRFLNAMTACSGTPTKTAITEGGKLSLSKGKFRALIALLPNDSFPKTAVSKGEVVSLPDMLSVFNRLRAFISNDASRPWSQGLLFRGQYCYATNNVIIARVPLKQKMTKDIILPNYAIDELQRIGREPNKITMTPEAIQFHFDTWWLKANSLNAVWPAVEDFFVSFPKKLSPVPPGLLDAVTTLKGMVPDPDFPIIEMTADRISTTEGDHFAQIEGMKLHEGRYNASMLQSVLSVATHIDFTQYPGRVPFTGDNGLVGFMVGLKR